MKSHLQIIPTKGMTQEDWLTYRASGIGASEVGSILGLDDYKSSLELYYEKIGEVPRLNIESISQFMGKEQEDFIAELWQYWEGSEESMIQNYRAGRIVRRCRRINAYVRNPQYPWLFVSLDRIINKHGGKEEGTLELKTIGGWEADKWESGLPPKHVTQVNTQMLVCEFPYGDMALFQDGRRYNVLPFDIHESICRHIIERTKEFWERVQEGRKLVNEKYIALTGFNQRQVDLLTARIDELAPPPDGTLAYADYLKVRHNDPHLAERRGSSGELEDAIAQADLHGRIKELEEQKTLRENRLKSALGDHQILDFGPDGKVYWTKSAGGRRNFRNKIKTNGARVL
jgi:putative phage-type endonuclease